MTVIVTIRGHDLEIQLMSVCGLLPANMNNPFVHFNLRITVTTSRDVFVRPNNTEPKHDYDLEEEETIEFSRQLRGHD